MCEKRELLVGRTHFLEKDFRTNKKFFETPRCANETLLRTNDHNVIDRGHVPFARKFFNKLKEAEGFPGKTIEGNGLFFHRTIVLFV